MGWPTAPRQGQSPAMLVMPMTHGLDDESACPAANQYSRAYLHHLFKCNEYLGPMMLSWNNLHYYQQLMGNLRAAIERKNIRIH